MLWSLNAAQEWNIAKASFIVYHFGFAKLSWWKGMYTYPIISCSVPWTYRSSKPKKILWSLGYTKYANCVGRDKLSMTYYTTYLYPQSVIQMAFLEVDNYLLNLLRRNIGVAVGLWNVSNAIHCTQLVCMEDEW